MSCSIDGCDQPVKARGWCSTHVQRYYRTGSPHVVRKWAVTGTLAERLWAKVEFGRGCWRFVGALTAAGYGHIGADGKLLYAHRVAYELANGPIPEGLHIDHLCRVRACVRPSHLEAVTQAENNRRAAQAHA